MAKARKPRRRRAPARRRTHAPQAVVIRKSHPRVRGMKKKKFARAAAAAHTEGKSVRKVDETKNTYRAEVRPKECFVPGTYRTQKRGKHVRVLYARLDPEKIRRRKACR